MIRASFGKTVARSMLIGGLALLAVPAVAGCEAGENAPTLEFHSASAGAHATVNGIELSNAFVLGAKSGSTVPAGGSASLFVGLYNNGSAADTLQSVSAQGHAASVTIKGGSAEIPAQGSNNLTGPEPELVLKGLTGPLASGTTVPVTFTFAHAGSATLNVPVEPQADYYTTYSPPAVAAAASPAAPGQAAGQAGQVGKAGAKASPKASGAASPAASPSPTATK